ncbi:hypothetical protein ACOME3_009470 [Neoechinorhynchus agilis]
MIDSACNTTRVNNQHKQFELIDQLRNECTLLIQEINRPTFKRRNVLRHIGQVYDIAKGIEKLASCAFPLEVDNGPRPSSTASATNVKYNQDILLNIVDSLNLCLGKSALDE